MRQQRADGVLTLITGSTRSGKTSAAMLDVYSALPLLVWDVEGQWSAMRQARAVSLEDLAVHTLARRFGRYALTVDPTPQNFTTFCRIAFAWAQLVPHATIVVEELADVTSPAKAPAAWGVLVRRGLKYGADIIAITNSPSESDKTVVRNASRKWCFLAEFAADRETLARSLDVDVATVAALRPLHYLYKARGLPARPGVLAVESLRKLAVPHTNPGREFL